MPQVRTARRRLVRVARTYSTEAPGRTCQLRVPLPRDASAEPRRVIGILGEAPEVAPASTAARARDGWLDLWTACARNYRVRRVVVGGSVVTGRLMWEPETGPFSTNIIDLVILITGQCGSVPNSEKHTLSRVFVYEDDDSYAGSGPPGGRMDVWAPRDEQLICL